MLKKKKKSALKFIYSFNMNENLIQIKSKISKTYIINSEPMIY